MDSKLSTSSLSSHPSPLPNSPPIRSYPPSGSSSPSTLRATSAPPSPSPLPPKRKADGISAEPEPEPEKLEDLLRWCGEAEAEPEPERAETRERAGWGGGFVPLPVFSGGCEKWWEEKDLDTSEEVMREVDRITFLRKKELEDSFDEYERKKVKAKEEKGKETVVEKEEEEEEDDDHGEMWY